MPVAAAANTPRALVGFALLAATSFAASGVFARDFEIRYHEPADVQRAGNMERIALTAHGRQFDLILESNAGVVGAGTADIPTAVSLYRGVLAGHADSWVRMSESHGRLSGAFWDGSELWLVDSAERLAPYLAAGTALPGAQTTVFRLSEVSGALSDVVARTDAVEPATALASFGPQPGRILDIGLVASADFSAQHGAAARDALLEMFNIVEGIFITQVGVQLRAAEIDVLTTDPAGLGETDPEALLGNFSEHKVRDAALYPLGLAHLFVARDLDDLDPPTRTVGMANLSVLCDRRFGVGITQATHASVLDALIAAHEIGHNFGAPHDAQAGSQCAAETDDFIMAPKISGSTRFSQCSIEQMQPEIAGAGCMREIPPTDLKLSSAAAPPATAAQRQSLEFELVLSNLSNMHAAGIELAAVSSSLTRMSLNIDAIDDGYCDTQASLRCVWPWLPAGASTLLTLTGTAQSVGPGSLQISVASLHELDASDNALTFDFEILPLAELLSLLTPTTAAMHPGESRRFEAAVSNRGAAPASNVTVYISLGRGLELTHNELRGCTQQREPEQVVHVCPIGGLRANSAWSFGFSVAVPAGFDAASIAQDPTSLINVYASSAETPLAEADRSALAVVTIGEQLADLSVSIDGPNLVEIGTEHVWEIEVVNLGPDPAEAIRVFDDEPGRTLPADGVSVATTAGECTLSGGAFEFECTIPSLGVGERASITLTGTPMQIGQQFWMDVAAMSAAPDGNPDNDRTSMLVAANDGVVVTPESNAAGSNVSASDDGGGGSLGLLSLLSLGALLRSRRHGRNGLGCAAAKPRGAVTQLR